MRVSELFESKDQEAWDTAQRVIKKAKRPSAEEMIPQVKKLADEVEAVLQKNKKKFKVEDQTKDAKFHPSVLFIISGEPDTIHVSMADYDKHPHIYVGHEEADSPADVMDALDRNRASIAKHEAETKVRIKAARDREAAAVKELKNDRLPNQAERELLAVMLGASNQGRPTFDAKNTTHSEIHFEPSQYMKPFKLPATDLEYGRLANRIKQSVYEDFADAISDPEDVADQEFDSWRDTLKKEKYTFAKVAKTWGDLAPIVAGMSKRGAKE